MTLDERNAVFSLIRFGCYTDMPDNVHINTVGIFWFQAGAAATLRKELSLN